MAYRLLVEQLFDNNGEPLNAGKVHVYEPGTTTDRDSYPTADDADASTNANANPVVADSAGRVQIWGRNGVNYKLVITDSADVTLATIDDISGPNSQQEAIGYYVGSGSANAQTVTPSPAWASYVTGSIIAWKPVADNTGASTLNVNGLGATTIKLVDGDDTPPGAVDASGIAVVQYDGTNFVLLNDRKAQMESGSVSVSISGAATATQAVNFRRTFPSAPHVVCSALDSVGNFLATPQTPTTTGFTVRIRDVDGTNRTGTATVYYIAVEQA